MKYLIIFFFSLTFCLLQRADADTYSLIRQGKIDEARSEIEAQTTAATRDGTLLFYQAMLESEGVKSFQFLEAAFKAEISPQYLEENIFLMAQYYQAAGNWGKVTSTAEAYLQHWELGRYRNEALRMASIAFEILGEMDKAEYYRNKLINENKKGRFEYIGELDRAFSLYGKKDYLAAQKICRNLRNSDYAEAAAPALYMLSHYSIIQKRIDDAILYYNILREGYPHAIGLDDLIDRFSQFEKKSDNNSAEKMTGTVYSVQVGVFSVKENAKDMAERMKQYGREVEIKDKIISDKKYRVVYVGRFVSSEEAMAFKSRLEQSENEVYQVVAR